MDQVALVQELQQIAGPDGVVHAPDALKTYEADASWLASHPPQVVVLPRTSEQVAEIVRLAARVGLPVVPRGAGTGVSGGAIPLRGGILISTARMDRVEALDIRNRRATLQPGVINAELNAQVASLGFQFAPDPSSQRACTIGGNIAENAGGPHCLKYGVTTNHVLAVEVALHDGRLLWTGDGVTDAAGYDLTGLIVGSEGTFGCVTRALVRLTRLPEQTRVVQALFPGIINASTAVSQIIATGYLPTSLEVMDAKAIQAVNSAYGLGLPTQAGAALIIEVDGVVDGLDDILAEILKICRANDAFELRPAQTPEEQAQVWLARKSVAGAIGRLAPAYYLVDTVVPRTRLPFMMEQVEQLSRTYNMEVLNVFHAGDGNLHPLVLYNPRDSNQFERAHAIAAAVLKLSIEQGGVISGEHGIGLEKQAYLPLLFSQADMQAMAAIQAIFNPDNLFNPGKIFPANIDPLRLAKQHRERLTANQGIKKAKAGQLANSLLAIVGPDRVLCNEAATAYAVQGQPPGYVAIPADLEQLSAVMAACHQAGASVVPWGGGSQQAIGRLSTAPDVVLVTRHLAGVLKYEPDDLTISAGAGMTLAELQAILANHSQMFPLDAPLPNRATLGGLVATATDGPRRLGYGTLRDLVLGLTIVEVDGTIIQTGGQVVKNVSGYDLVKLFLGSHGGLGVIAGVSLKTLPRPRSEATLLMGFSNPHQVLTLLTKLSESYLTPTAVEYLSDFQLWIVDYELEVEQSEIPCTVKGRQNLSQRHSMEKSKIGLAIRTEGTEVACRRHLTDLWEMAEHLGATEVYELRAEAQQTLWARIADLSATGSLEEETALLRLAVLPTELGPALADLESGTAAHGLTYTCNARAMNGLIYARLNGPAQGVKGLQNALVARWRHSHLLACDPALKYSHSEPVLYWGVQPEAIEVMRQIKRAFDPAGLLNPGRYIV